MAIGFEASVGGGVPIIRTLREALAGDRQRAVYGIVNGTCNSILTMMTEQGAEFSEALAEAQRTGLAEANPALDIEGHDAAHKLCLLVTLAFGALLKPLAGPHRGHQPYHPGRHRLRARVGLYDQAARDRQGRRRRDRGPRASHDDSGAPSAGRRGRRVQRDLYSRRGAGLDHVFRAGRGADADGDRRDGRCARDRARANRRRRRARPSAGLPDGLDGRARVKPMDGVLCEYYLRFEARDKPGVLGAIASVLGRSGISIASVIQQGRGVEGTVPVIMRTHEAHERNLKRALARIKRLHTVSGTPGFHPNRGAAVARWRGAGKTVRPRRRRA